MIKIQTDERSLLNINVLNALLLISMNAPKAKTPETSEMTKQTMKTCVEQKHT